MADNNSDAGEIIMIDQIPFYMVQPTEKLKKIFAHYLPLLKETLGEDLVSLHPFGSASIPGMCLNHLVRLSKAIAGRKITIMLRF